MTRKRDLSALEARLGYRFKNIALLEQALTHKSVSARHRKRTSNQRLEFLGDRVLALAVAEMLFHSFEKNPEGELTHRHAALVKNDTCVEVAAELQLGDFVEFEASEQTELLRANATVLGDACEAVVAAVFLDGGYEAGLDLVQRFWRDRMNSSVEAPRHAKMILQEWAHARGLSDPKYREVERSGPSHKPQFRIAVELSGLAPAEGTGLSKREAEQAAASAMLTREGVHSNE